MRHWHSTRSRSVWAAAKALTAACSRWRGYLRPNRFRKSVRSLEEVPMPINLHTLPQFADRISWIYVEYGHLEKDNDGLVFIDKAGRTPLPVAATSMVMLGPGTTLTHRAVIAAAQMNCLLSWVGEGVTRTYALSTGGASHTTNLQRQARLWADPALHLAVVRNLYAMRFPDPIPPDTTLEQIRGMEGARVRSMYQRLAQEVGITWVMRHY